MMERVARALAVRSLKRAAERSDENGGHSAWTLEHPAELKRVIDYDWPRFSDDARAAIAAKREPLAAIVADRAAHYTRKADERDPLESDACTERERYEFAAEATEWLGDAIDAALREPPRPDATGIDRGREEP